MRRVFIIMLFFCWALYSSTYGPTVPEVSKFEPFDATELVDLYTGDFVYTLPLMEVPGPAGGYPITLSYKAGIPTNDVSSWVGLGWNLTPGYINRSTVGLPDDMHAGNVLQVTKDKFSQHFGGNIGFVSFGGHYDNTQGFSSYFEAKYEKEWSEGSKVSAGLRIDRGGIHGSMSRSINGYSSSNQTSIASNGISAGIGKSSGRLPFSISSTSGNPYIYGSGRAWFFEFGFGQGSGTYEVNSYGHLYADQMMKDAEADRELGSWMSAVQRKLFTASGYKIVGSIISDIGDRGIVDLVLDALVGDQNLLATDLYQTEVLVENIDKPDFAATVDDDHPYQHPHMFLSTDGYMVSAQGLNGVMVPQRKAVQTVPRTDVFNSAYNKDIFGADLDFVSISNEHFYLNVAQNAYSPLADKTESHQFRFMGDPGGKQSYENGKLVTSGSRKVWYEKNDDKTISKIHITKEDGITYHFEKAACNTEQYAVSLHQGEETWTDVVNTLFAEVLNNLTLWPVTLFDGNINLTDLHSAAVDFAITINDQRDYAYAWLLTSVTGPDYVDLDHDGIIEKGDFGYWVRFNYPENPDLDDYKWREPVYGFRTAGKWNPYEDGEEGNKGFGAGKKDIYYLNSIETPTHVAVFETSDRHDAYQCMITKDAETLNDYFVLTQDVFDFENVGDKVDRLNKVSPFSVGGGIDFSKTLRKLDRIVLYRQEQWDDANGNHLVDAGEITGTGGKQVDFGYTYELCKGTPNSDSDESGWPGGSEDGKLTLKEVLIAGAGGIKTIPSYVFSYNAHDPESNPDYHHLDWDRWGYYKKNGRNGNQWTNPSQVDAWSLRSILTPSGAKLNVEYESDNYARVQDMVSAKPLKFEGNKVHIKYITENHYGSDPRTLLKGISVPVAIAEHLTSGDRISLDAKVLKIDGANTDLTAYMEAVFDKLSESEALDVLSEIWATATQAIECGASASVCHSSCETIFGPGPITTAILRGLCHKRCVRNDKNCFSDVGDCIEKLKTSAEDEFKDQATILMSSLIDWVAIPNWEGVITKGTPKDGYVDLTFDGNYKELQIKTTGSLLRTVLDPLEQAEVICGSGDYSSIFDIDELISDNLTNLLRDVLSGTGIGDWLDRQLQDCGTVCDIITPLPAGLTDLVGNDVHLKIEKIIPTGFENLATRIKTEKAATMLTPDGYFKSGGSHNNYFMMKHGGGIRVKSLSLDDGFGKVRKWRYFYDFLGNGTGITSGVATSEPAPHAQEAQDDRLFPQEQGANYYLPGPMVGYERVTVQTEGEGKSVTEFVTPADHPYRPYRGDGNKVHKYFDPSLAYGKMKLLKNYSDGIPEPVIEKEFLYSFTYPGGSSAPDATPKSILTKRSNGTEEKDNLGWVRASYANYLASVRISNWIPGNSIEIPSTKILQNTYQYDMPGYFLTEMRVVQDNVAQKTRNLLWDWKGGHVLRVTEGNWASGWKITEEVPMYHTLAHGPDFENKNMLTQKYQVTTYENSSQRKSGATPVQSEVSEWHRYDPIVSKQKEPLGGAWSSYAGKASQWYKLSTWKWSVQGPQPDQIVQFDKFDESWVMQEMVNRRDVYGREMDVENAVGEQTSIVRGYKGDLVTAVIRNANYFEAGVLTCEYDEGMAPGSRNWTYLDWDDGWERAQGCSEHFTIPAPTASIPDQSPRVQLTEQDKHYGLKSILVRNAFGPTRNFRIEKGKDYVLSAWVKAKSGNLRLEKAFIMGADYRRERDPGTWPLTLAGAEKSASGKVTTREGSNGWKQVVLDIPATSDLTSQDWANGINCVRLFVGVPFGDGQGNGAEVYVDDIRFAPKNALVTSYYYDASVRKPRTFVDENSNATKYYYDPYGRLVRKDNARGNRVESYEYNMGLVTWPPSVEPTDYRPQPNALAVDFHLGSCGNASDKSYVELSWKNDHPLNLRYELWYGSSPGHLVPYANESGQNLLKSEIITKDGKQRVTIPPGGDCALIAPGKELYWRLKVVDAWHGAEFTMPETRKFRLRPDVTISKPEPGEVYLDNNPFVVEWTQLGYDGNVVLQLEGPETHVLHEGEYSRTSGQNKHRFECVLPQDVHLDDYVLGVHLTGVNYAVRSEKFTVAATLDLRVESITFDCDESERLEDAITLYNGYDCNDYLKVTKPEYSNGRQTNFPAAYLHHPHKEPWNDARKIKVTFSANRVRTGKAFTSTAQIRGGSPSGHFDNITTYLGTREDYVPVSFESDPDTPDRGIAEGVEFYINEIPAGVGKYVCDWDWEVIGRGKVTQTQGLVLYKMLGEQTGIWKDCSAGPHMEVVDFAATYAMEYEESYHLCDQETRVASYPGTEKELLSNITRNLIREFPAKLSDEGPETYTESNRDNHTEWDFEVSKFIRHLREEKGYSNGISGYSLIALNSLCFSLLGGDADAIKIVVPSIRDDGDGDTYHEFRVPSENSRWQYKRDCDEYDRPSACEFERQYQIYNYPAFMIEYPAYEYPSTDPIYFSPIAHYCFTNHGPDFIVGWEKQYALERIFHFLERPIYESLEETEYKIVDFR